ncbi:MAG TPA: hypothetical protein PKH32_00540, partial [Verrucomicrobiota bacterium]|nr:hypothetical protein [Verrucomicrobiota bacterium]
MRDSSFVDRPSGESGLFRLWTCAVLLLAVAIAHEGFCAGSGGAAPRAWGDWPDWGDQGDGTYRNPVLPSDYSD